MSISMQAHVPFQHKPALQFSSGEAPKKDQLPDQLEDTMQTREQLADEFEQKAPQAARRIQRRAKSRFSLSLGVAWALLGLIGLGSNSYSLTQRYGTPNPTCTALEQPAQIADCTATKNNQDDFGQIALLGGALSLLGGVDVLEEHIRKKNAKQS